MFKKSTWLHLRIPFSYFLLPIFLLGLAVSNALPLFDVVILFLVLHIFIYPASNAFNSYFDKDEGSIGGLKNPPKVDIHVYRIAQLFDLIGLGLAFICFQNIQLTAMLVVYVLASRAYSHPIIRLKKYPFTSWLIAGFFQGAWVVWMVILTLNDYNFSQVLESAVFLPGIFASLILWGSYPITQVYQHEEDEKRGDITLSIRLGIRGTFVFSGIMLFLAAAGFCYYFMNFMKTEYIWVFVMCALPILVYFNTWAIKVWKDVNMADFKHTMRMNFLASSCFGLLYVLIILDRQFLFF